MSTWEARMSAAAAERAAAAAAAEPVGCQIGDSSMPTGHEGHHLHFVPINGIDCSCGAGMGCFSFIPDSRWGSDDPAEVEAVRREEEAWVASLSCSICGAKGVQAHDDWGSDAG